MNDKVAPCVAGRLRPTLPALTGVHPFQQEQCAFGVGAGSFRLEQQMQSLPRNPEYASEPGFVPTPAEQVCRGLSERIPARRPGPRPQNETTRGPLTQPSRLPRTSRRQFAQRDYRGGHRLDVMHGSVLRSCHPTTVGPTMDYVR